ncbi:uncharacterized protein LOC116614564 [Nematostella vectensis]|uniref:uncharacterized protein LOC116614564 n=1 Tax=Nematostella vectensis TaxID=45351 RepID=UPI00139007B6|nr:uncharacterized protein LOC116614564 [Nematostella vectensis]
MKLHYTHIFRRRQTRARKDEMVTGVISFSTDGTSFLILLLLITPAASITCYDCTSQTSEMTSCHARAVNCSRYHNACHVIYMVLSYPGFSAKFYMKKCSYAETCVDECRLQNATQNGAVNKCHVACCVTDLCNASFDFEQKAAARSLWPSIMLIGLTLLVVILQ